MMSDGVIDLLTVEDLDTTLDDFLFENTEHEVCGTPEQVEPEFQAWFASDAETELWQYVPMTHSSKPEAKTNACATSVKYCTRGQYAKFGDDYHNLPYVRLHQFNFQSLVDAARHGVSLKRVPVQHCTGSVPSTRFVFIDLDNDEWNGKCPNITREDLKVVESDSVVVLPSTSGNGFKHHIFIHHPEPIYPTNYKQVYLDYSKLIEEKIGKQFKSDMSVTDWCHWVLGPSVDNPGDYVIDENDIQTLQLTQKRPNVQLRPSKREQKMIEQIERSIDFHIVPDTMSGIMKAFDIDFLESVGFRSHLPWVKRGRIMRYYKIGKGERYNTLSAYMLALYDFWRLYNCIADELGEPKLDENDLLSTFDYKSKNAYDDYACDNFESDLDAIRISLRQRISDNRDMSDREWIEYQRKRGLVAYRHDGKTVQTVWKRAGRDRSEVLCIATKHGCDRGCTMATFESVDVLNILLETKHLSMSTFKRYMKEFGYRYRCMSKKSRKKSKVYKNASHRYIVDNAVDGVYHYDKWNRAEYNYAHRHGIQYVQRGPVSIS